MNEAQDDSDETGGGADSSDDGGAVGSTTPCSGLEVPIKMAGQRSRGCVDDGLGEDSLSLRTLDEPIVGLGAQLLSSLSCTSARASQAAGYANARTATELTRTRQRIHSTDAAETPANQFGCVRRLKGSTRSSRKTIT